jgi:hypothetical protein
MILRGFLKGPFITKKENIVPSCIVDKIDDIARHAENSVDYFRMADFSEIISGMKEISIMLDIIRKSEDDCYKQIKTDWELFDQMSLAWNSPVTFAYSSEKETLVNGKNIYSQIS